MKKYVKPIMESEAFIANEYIGACFYVDCLNPNCNMEGYAMGEKSVYGSAEFMAISGFADANGGIVGDDYSAGKYDIFNDESCCNDGCYNKVADVHWFIHLLMDIYYGLTGRGDWNPPVVETPNHHHVSIRPTTKADAHPNHS